MVIKCADFAISLKDEILFVPLHENKLFSITTTKMKTTPVLDVSPNKILAIHISKHNELLLSLRDSGQRFPVTDCSTRQVVVFGTNHKHRSTFERDTAGKKSYLIM